MAKKRKTNIYKPEEYTFDTLREDREYGFYWYEWLWKIVRPVLVFLCSLLIILGIGSMAYDRLYNAIYAPMDPSSGDLVTFEIKSGESVTTIGKNLVNQKLLRNATVFKYIVQFKGLTNAISYGEYELSPAMTANEIATVLSSGVQTDERTITIIPGWTAEDIADYLVSEGAISDREEFLKLCNEPEKFVGYSYALSGAYNNDLLGGRKYALEGYFAPDTYRVFRSADAESIIKTLLSQHNEVIDNVFYEDHSEYEIDENGAYTEVMQYRSELTMDQVIILASMIEREAGVKGDYSKVSAVFHNRINQGMKLESDATVNYITGKHTLVLSSEDLALESPYNTYYTDSLPAGPICNPSADALLAALYPDVNYIAEGYLYFCGREPSSGELIFAKTLEEHQANVEKYRPLWQAYDELH